MLQGTSTLRCREAKAEAGRVDLQVASEGKSVKTRRTIQGQYLENNCAMLTCKYDCLLFFTE